MPENDSPPVARRIINLRASTVDELEKFREEIEPGTKESWDNFFRRMLKEKRFS